MIKQNPDLYLPLVDNLPTSHHASTIVLTEKLKWMFDVALKAFDLDSDEEAIDLLDTVLEGFSVDTNLIVDEQGGEASTIYNKYFGIVRVHSDEPGEILIHGLLVAYRQILNEKVERGTSLTSSDFNSLKTTFQDIISWYTDKRG